MKSGTALYDEALLKKIKYWVSDLPITVTGVDETRRIFEYIADTTNDNAIKLPLITIRKRPTITLNSTNKKALTFDGWRKNNDGKRGDQLNGIPIHIEYAIDIYTRHYEESEEYIRNFVFNIVNYPKLHIEIPYNDSKIIHNSNIRLEPDINDNSDIPERLISGQFTRRTLLIYIDDAYYFDYRTKETWKVDPDVEVN
mgnify:CR=1 FL=1